MVEVVATQVQTYRVRRSNGTEAVVVASDDRNTLEVYGRSADRKVWIKRNDMNAEMTQTAVISVIKGLERFGQSDYSDIAEYVKTEFNTKFGKTWHCLVILRGGFSVQNETNCYICLDIDDYMVILFKQ